jgi:hypothetical protein
MFQSNLIRNLALTCEIKNNAISNLELQNLHLIILPTTTNLHGISITHEISTLDSKKHFNSLFMMPWENTLRKQETFRKIIKESNTSQNLELNYKWMGTFWELD